MAKNRFYKNVLFVFSFTLKPAKKILHRFNLKFHQLLQQMLLTQRQVNQKNSWGLPKIALKTLMSAVTPKL